MDPQSMQEALSSFDGMVRASEDWTISIMNPYYAAIADTKVDGEVGSVDETKAIARITRAPASISHTHSTNTRHTDASSSLSTSPNHYLETFMSRMAGEMDASSNHSLLQPGER